MKIGKELEKEWYSPKKSLWRFILSLVIFAIIYKFFDDYIAEMIDDALVEFGWEPGIASYVGEIIGVVLAGLIGFIPIMNVLLSSPEPPSKLSPMKVYGITIFVLINTGRRIKGEPISPVTYPISI